MERVYLRALEPDDAEFVYEVENSADQVCSSVNNAPLSLEQIRSYALTYDGDIMRAGQLRLIIMSGESRIGIADLYDADFINGRAEIGIYIKESARGAGMARRALDCLLDYVFKVLNLNQVYSRVETDNEASRSLFEGAGFRQAGLLKDWIREGSEYHDVIFYQNFRSS